MVFLSHRRTAPRGSSLSKAIWPGQAEPGRARRTLGTFPWPRLGLGTLQAGGSTWCLEKAFIRGPRGGTLPGDWLSSPPYGGTDERSPETPALAPNKVLRLQQPLLPPRGLQPRELEISQQPPPQCQELPPLLPTSTRPWKYS